jgi:tRNA(His) 5'-end guanylyltransferase
MFAFMIAHINNLYNTTFWSLVQQGGQTTTKAHATLRVSSFLLVFTNDASLFFFLVREHFRKIKMRFFTLSLGLVMAT